MYQSKQRRMNLTKPSSGGFSKASFNDLLAGFAFLG
jgi:hypothetical protein